MKRVVGVIPARWQSSRFPGKPLVNILGKSLIQRTYENAARSKSLDALLIATDDRRILEHAHGFGAEVCMTSEGCATGTDRAWEAVQHVFPDASIVVNIQGDEPCLEPEVIDRLVGLLQNTPEAVMTTPISPIGVEQALLPTLVKCVFDQQGRALYFSRSPIPFMRQIEQASLGFAPQYFRHIGVYCFRRSALEQYVRMGKTPLQMYEDLEQLKMLENGLPIHVCQVNDQATGVDTPADLQTVERLLCQQESMYLSQEVSSPLWVKG
jgi:3-deoxy-manno-octulosonate cytidylyltransferase (CMP-KDO synthetase)